jgi:hypothetical protein
MAVHASEPGVARRDNVNWFELGNLTGGSGGTSAAVSSTSAGPSDVVSYS